MSEEIPKRKKRWVPNARRTLPKVPERLPYYKENPPRYEPAQQPRQSFANQHPQAVGAVVAIIITIVVVFVVFTLSGFNPFDVLGGDGSGSGEVRNCIKSVMRDYPSCSDDDGVSKATYLNGRYIGNCHYVDNVGNCY